MRRILLFAGFIICIANTALAADWSGVYLGLNAGGVWGTKYPTLSANTGGALAPFDSTISAAGSQSFRNSGFVGGGQVGINWQRQNLVFGIEADFEYFNPKGSQTTAGFIPNTTNFTVAQSASANWLFTARPRIGLASGNWLIYVTGGVAVANLKYTETFSSTTINAVGTTLFGSESESASKTKAGGTIGGGLELTMSNRMSVRAEYLYVDFGSLSSAGTFCITTTPAICGPFSQSMTFKENLVRIAVNWKL